jgi:hypothetical protein
VVARRVRPDKRWDGHWTGPHTLIPQTLGDFIPYSYTNFKVDAHTYTTNHKHTPLSQTTKHGALLARATADGAYFTFHKKRTSLTHVQFTHKQEFMWGVHNTRLLSHNPTLHCLMCGQFTSNGHMAGNCPSMSGLRHDRHNSALHLLLSFLERHNGGRRETITADFGNKSIESLTSPTLIHTPLDFHPPLPTHMPTCLIGVDEGVSTDSLTSCPAILPDEILPSVLRPPAYKPDLIRLLEPRFVGHTNGRRRYFSTKKIQIGE